MTVDTNKLADVTFVDILCNRAQATPDNLAYRFLHHGETNQAQISFSELDRQARHIAAYLQLLTQPGERALLLYQPGLEYIAAVFGCFYAGVIAVPAYPPRLNQNLGRIESIITDAQAKLALTSSSLLSSLQRKFTDHPLIQGLRWLATDEDTENRADDWRNLPQDPTSLALLQYTSGSTGNPKGVMISHGNLIYNASLQASAMEMTTASVGGNWLPPYHDMGLMGTILGSVYVGLPSIFMAPSAFLQQPLRWLQMISHYRVTIAGGPNFAFDLCSRSLAKASPELLAELDLSSWMVAFTGGEPVRKETLDRFTQTFAPFGFRPETFYPCYGLAETTLFTTGGRNSALAQTVHGDAIALEHGRFVEVATDAPKKRSLVSSGFIHAAEQSVIIVHPELHTRCAIHEVGEIWVSAPNVASGYWQNPDETTRSFQAYTRDSHEGPFLRTGDLGFFAHNELFVTGRLKDLIIVRGRNLYPQDIELVAEQSHPALRSGCCVAFAQQDEHSEHIVIVLEIERHHEKWDKREIVQSILQAVSQECDIEVAVVELIRPGTIHKTSSGKLQHQACRQSFQDGTLQSIYHWSIFEESPTPPQHIATLQGQVSSIPLSGNHAEHPSLEAITSWLITRVAERSHLPPHQIETHAPFVHYGLGSVDAVALSGELEQWLGRSLSPTLVYDYPSIETLARYLAYPDSPGKSREQAASHHTTQQTLTSYEPIAIVGIACRFPGADNLEEFWHLLCTGGDGVREIPEDRWDGKALYTETPATMGKASTRWGGFLSQVDRFDARFFGISQREASQMDPQQRILLETAWEAFEHAGLIPKTLAHSQTGVFIGASSSDYYLLHHADPQYHTAYAGTGSAHSILANRLSYFFDLHGPSMVIDSACSSSLAAVHQACLSIRAGECSLAIAGGVNVVLAPEFIVAFSQARMMSPTGQCKTFDAAADGYVRSEGCGVLLLKSLADAQRDKNTIYAVIRGSAINQDGLSNGITAPNRLAQEAVIQQALARATIAANEIGYVETHGSGTPLGDPIEIQALTTVLMHNRTPEHICLLGAVKTNIGHLEAAAGIAGLIKTILVVKHAEIPPNLHFSTPNPHIPFEQTHFVLPTKRQPWPSVYKRRVAGVSAFGFGGTNVHVVLEEPPPSEGSQTVPAEDEGRHHLLLLSAHTQTALHEITARYRAWIQAHPAFSLADLCFTAATSRQPFSHRLAIVADTREQLATYLSARREGASPDIRRGVYEGQERPKIAFLFTGQGPQYVYMARSLYETQPTFKRELDRCIEAAEPYLECSLLEVLYPTATDPSLLNQMLYAQPATFAIGYALAALWRSWHIEPDVVMGHSAGEYVAACVAGMMSPEEGMRLMVTRGRLMQNLAQEGTMIVAFAAPDRLTPFIEPFKEKVAIAAFNGPAHTTVSGEIEALHNLVQVITEHGIETRSLMISQASHSPLVDPLLDALVETAQQIDWQPGQLPLVANLSGQLLPVGTQLDASYWRRQTREPVQFARSIEALKEYGCTVFLEIGPHPTLAPLGKQCLHDDKMQWLFSLHRHTDNWHTLLQSAAALFTAGVQLDWNAFYQEEHRQRVSLPSYPFERDLCWFTSSTLSTTRADDLPPPQKTSTHPFLDACPVQIASANIHAWQCTLSAQRFPHLSHYRLRNQPIVPFFTYIELALAAARETFGPAAYTLLDTEVKRDIHLSEQEEWHLQVVLTASEQQRFNFQIFCHDTTPTKGSEDRADSWRLHVAGSLQSSAGIS